MHWLEKLGFTMFGASVLVMVALPLFFNERHWWTAVVIASIVGFCGGVVAVIGQDRRMK